MDELITNLDSPQPTSWAIAKIEEDDSSWFLDDVKIMAVVLGTILLAIVLLVSITICCVRNQRVIAVAPEVTIHMPATENNPRPHEDIYYNNDYD